jgi:hypothetical protein
MTQELVEKAAKLNDKLKDLIELYDKRIASPYGYYLAYCIPSGKLGVSDRIMDGYWNGLIDDILARHSKQIKEELKQRIESVRMEIAMLGEDEKETKDASTESATIENMSVVDMDEEVTNPILTFENGRLYVHKSKINHPPVKVDVTEMVALALQPRHYDYSQGKRLPWWKLLWIKLTHKRGL